MGHDSTIIMLPIILASSSPYRRHLLSQLGLQFTSVSPNINESPRPAEDAAALVSRLAQNKAQAVANNNPAQLIIASDQVASLEGQVINKPGNHQAAFKQLSHSSGKQLTFYTGLCLLNSQTGHCQQSIETFKVQFRKLDSKQIERYLQAEQPYDCAGSFKMEGLGISLFERLMGDDPNSLIGLPLIRLVELLNNEGIAIP